MLTFLSLEEIEEMEKWDDSRINEKKEILAFELTQLVHGTEEAVKAQNAARALFAGGQDDENMPTTTIGRGDMEDGKISVTQLLVLSGLASSKGEAKRLIEQGGVLINETKVESFAQTVGEDDFKDGKLILKKGKKKFQKIVLE